MTKLEMKGMLIVLKFDWGYSVRVCVCICVRCSGELGGGGASGPDAIHS